MLGCALKIKLVYLKNHLILQLVFHFCQNVEMKRTRLRSVELKSGKCNNID